MKRTTKFSYILVISGTISSAFSKWFLVWLFAQSDGGAEAVGLYSMVLAVATPLFVTAQLGLRTIFVSHETRWPWSTYLFLRGMGTFIGMTILLTYVFFTANVPFYLGLAITLLKIADSISDIYAARLQYFHQIQTLGLLSILSSLITILLASISVYVFHSVTWAIVAAAMTSAIFAMAHALLGRRFEYASVHEKGGYRGIIQASIPVTASQFLSTFLFQIPVLFLGMISNPQTVGVFAASAYLLTIANIFGSSLQTILNTPFRREREKNGVKAVARRAFAVTRSIAFIGIIPVILVAFWGSKLFQVIYGPAFAIPVLPIVLISLAALLNIMAYVQSVTLNVLNRYSIVTWSMAGSCLVAVLNGLIAFFVGVPDLTIGAICAFSGSVTRALFMAVIVSRVTEKIQ
ncbi:polysaccharide biosynthesis protein [Corynebacterium efficiens YS-314]|uniref:Polysaccharide biosynthesis protein C-terminal domain-containing protein n=1 Tax=Corynebacterium efficiens (strain DSM 44549 / YS-314 / AJ 12310 / JCM 11189 / NBRC 100395) TaxID=196164 RepID=Q8FSL2_COREF|nr:oligosaccharide flippase family protein [Corynebacterium efficiens]EEW48400.1 polysaccharide biosynthesis protein [Corynebacterium efficiens YS-314]BAC17188.1 hypothetical protein [Corynebacterium efficiens YS-314]